MTDSGGSQSTAGFDYDRYGHVIPPQGSLPWDLATGFFAMAIPFIAPRLSMHDLLPPLGLQSLSIFQLAISRDLMSESQLKNVELLLVVLIIARLASFPAFLKKYTRLYSKQRRPPDLWREAWPRQVRRLLLIAAIFIGALELVGLLIRFSSYPMTAREVILPTLILAIGMWMLMGSLLSAALYSVFYRTYWRDPT